MVRHGLRCRNASAWHRVRPPALPSRLARIGRIAANAGIGRKQEVRSNSRRIGLIAYPFNRA
jgi:hypothetical protein